MKTIDAARGVLTFGEGKCWIREGSVRRAVDLTYWPEPAEAMQPKKLAGRDVQYRVVGATLYAWPTGSPAPLIPLYSAEGEQTSSPDQAVRTFDDAVAQVMDGETHTGVAVDRFANPYNFVTLQPRPAAADAPSGEARELCDGPPAGHDRLIAEGWNGRIAVTLTVQTPLLSLDPRTRKHLGNQHYLYGTRKDAAGNPVVEVTSIKGMLRSSYEAITNSRFGVFRRAEQGRRLARRMAAAEAGNQGEGRLRATRVEGHQLRELEAAWVLAYPHGRSAPVLKDHVDHGTFVYCDVAQMQHHRAGQVLVVTALHDAPAPDGARRRGWVYRTAAKVGGKYPAWTRRKHYERIFLEPLANAPARTWRFDERLWEDVIRNYRDARAGEDLLAQEHSRHLSAAGAEALKDGDLCYARIERNTVTAILPVLISRELYNASPWELLDDGHKPATTHAEASPADRVFGWVPDGPNPERPSSAVGSAYRGHLRVHGVRCATPRPDGDGDTRFRRFGTEGLSLSVLGKPKPQFAPFYLRAPDGTPLDLPRSRDWYKPGQALAGRKVYPHHAYGDGEHWHPEGNAVDPVGQGYREFRDIRSEGEPSRHNRSVQDWIEPGVAFDVSIDVHNLPTVELGALLWLFQLPQGCYLRMGYGKPLGFGSVRLILDHENTRLERGHSIAQRYEALTSGTGADSLEGVVDAYKRAIVDLGWQASISEFLAASRGTPTLRVHYPRRAPQPNPEDPGYNWFRDVRKPLPRIINQDPLPYQIPAEGNAGPRR